MDISVVVPLYKAAPFLPALLTSLEKQTFNLARFEVILVDDLSPDNTRQVVEQLQAKTPLNLQTVWRTANGGVSAARNSGWQAAHAPLIVFIDQDCLPDPAWLWEHYRAHQEYGAKHCVAGRIEWAANFRDNPASEYYKQGYFPNWENYRPGGQNFDFFITSNASVAKAGLEQVGGFDERFRHNYDDIVCGYRLEQAGYKIGLCADALVYHARNLPVAEMLRRCRVAGREMVRFILHYPELIDHFFTLNPAEAFDWGWRLPTFSRLLSQTLDRLPVSELKKVEVFLQTSATYFKEHSLPTRRDELYSQSLQANQQYYQAEAKARWLEAAYKMREFQQSQSWLTKFKTRRLTKNLSLPTPAVLDQMLNHQQQIAEQPSQLLEQYCSNQSINAQIQTEFPALYAFYFSQLITSPTQADLQMLYDSVKEYALSEGVLEGLREFYNIEQYTQLESHPLFGRWFSEWETRRAAQLSAQIAQAAASQPELDGYLAKLATALASR